MHSGSSNHNGDGARYPHAIDEPSDPPSGGVPLIIVFLKPRDEHSSEGPPLVAVKPPPVLVKPRNGQIFHALVMVFSFGTFLTAQAWFTDGLSRFLATGSGLLVSWYLALLLQYLTRKLSGRPGGKNAT